MGHGRLVGAPSSSQQRTRQHEARPSLSRRGDRVCRRERTKRLDRVGAVPVPPNYVGAPGSQEAEPPTAAELDNVRAQITTWLVHNGFRGYGVAEVSAFTNSDGECCNATSICGRAVASVQPSK